MGAPIICCVNVRHGCSNATLRHNGVSFAEQGFADHGHSCPLREGLDCRTKPGAASADDQDIMFVSFVSLRHKSLRSEIAPEATNLMYRSASPTETRLSHAKSMWCSMRKLAPRQVA